MYCTYPELSHITVLLREWFLGVLALPGKLFENCFPGRTYGDRSYPIECRDLSKVPKHAL